MVKIQPSIVVLALCCAFGCGASGEEPGDETFGQGKPDDEDGGGEEEATCADTCKGCCDGMTCRGGRLDDACGVNGAPCVSCRAPETCEAGRCECVPDCEDRECGPDPQCGESCGACMAGYSCMDGLCIGDGRWFDCGCSWACKKAWAFDDYGSTEATAVCLAPIEDDPRHTGEGHYAAWGGPLRDACILDYYSSRCDDGFSCSCRCDEQEDSEDCAPEWSPPSE